MKENDENKIYNSEELYKELNEERAREGKAEMPSEEVDSMGKTRKFCIKTYFLDKSCTRKTLEFQLVTHPVELTLKKQKKMLA